MQTFTCDCTPHFVHLYKSTGKERDAETGLDWFEARYMASPQVRFLSPDPENSNAMASDPQSWNTYAYGRNSPLKYVDPTGLSYEICDANGKCSKDQLGDKEFEAEKKNGQSNGEYFTGGKLYHFDSDGNKVSDGTYWQTDVDVDNPYIGGIVAGVRAAGPVNDPRVIAGFYGASALGGLAFYAGGAFAGELATLGLESATATEGSSALTSALQISKHAAERMAERGFTKDMIRATIKNGTRYWDPKNGMANYILRGGFASGKNALVGANPITNTVTTVIRGASVASWLIPFYNKDHDTEDRINAGSHCTAKARTLGPG